MWGIDSINRLFIPVKGISENTKSDEKELHVMTFFQRNERSGNQIQCSSNKGYPLEFDDPQFFENFKALLQGSSIEKKSIDWDAYCKAEDRGELVQSDDFSEIHQYRLVRKDEDVSQISSEQVFLSLKISEKEKEKRLDTSSYGVVTRS